jgi:TatD DNase family protein
MRLPLPPLDCHAHVETGIDEVELRELRAVVVAVTRDPGEWERALARTDPTTLWGIGAHPGVAKALAEFDGDRFQAALTHASFVGEVGLDGRASTDKNRQEEVFDAVLELVAAEPRPLTIHSSGASGKVLAALEDHRVPGAVLHWWRGDETETKRAVDLGCFFSINAHEIQKPLILDWLPSERLLTETDFPHSRRYDRGVDRPGKVDIVERELERRWGVDRLEVRRRLWRNFGALLSETGTVDRMPTSVLAALATTGFEG